MNVRTFDGTRLNLIWFFSLSFFTHAHKHTIHVLHSLQMPMRTANVQWLRLGIYAFVNCLFSAFGVHFMPLLIEKFQRQNKMCFPGCNSVFLFLIFFLSLILTKFTLFVYIWNVVCFAYLQYDCMFRNHIYIDRSIWHRIFCFYSC